MNNSVDVEQIKNTLADYKQKIEIELKKYLAKKTKEAYQTSRYCGEMLDHITDITLRGGKRIRAALLFYSYMAHGGKDEKMALYASMSIELAQTYLLIHDDIMDRDILRRGGSTIHHIYRQLAEKRYKGRIESEHYGRSIAILAGDTANGFSNEILAELPIDSKLTRRALLELNKMYNKEYFGQLLDINSELIDNVSRNDVVRIHELKTSPYTFDTPMKLGAILAGADEKTVDRLSKYAIPLGVAFQIQDDILGMFGREEKLGKPTTSDLREGKRTLLILDALEKADRGDRQTILENLGNESVGEAELQKVKEIVQKTGALEMSRDMAKGFVNKAIEGIEHLNLEEKGRNFLVGIANYMIKREY